MMAALREWLTSVVAVTLLISLVQTLVPEGTLRKVSSFVGGLILLAALVQPLLKVQQEELSLDLSGYTAQIEAQKQTLEQAGQAQLAEEVARLTADTIEAKASEQGLLVTARVRTESGTDGIPYPAAVTLKGEYSAALADWIRSELGISAASQVWRK